MSKAILKLSLEFAVYPSAKTLGISPDYQWSGTAFKVITAQGPEDCIDAVKAFCRDSGFSIIKERINESRIGSSPASGNENATV